MKKSRYLSLVTLAVMLVTLLAAPFATAEEAPVVLRVAVENEPNTLDNQVVTNDCASTIGQHIFETLYTYDEDYNVVPLLAESEETLEDGKVVKIHLRQGVTFHDGKEMTAEDVYASLNRWIEYGSRSSQMREYLDNIEVEDAYTVTLNFKQTYSPWKNLFAFINGGPAIYPKEVAETATQQPITEDQYIGTGPYRFVEHEQARHFKLEKYADYAAREDAANGLSGNRTGHVDEIYFIPVTNAQTRINGLYAGDYDYVRIATGDMYDELAANKDIVVSINKGTKMPLMFFNSKDRIFKDNDLLRQAVLTALDMEEIMAIAVGPDVLWELNGSINPEWNIFYSEAGVDTWNQADPEKARQMAEEAGYQGETIVILINNTHQLHIDACTVIAQQLEAAGFSVDAQRLDSAAQQAKRADETQWDIHFTHHIFSPEPIIYNWMNAGYAGWWDTEEKNDLVSQYVAETDPVKQAEIWDQIHALTYQQIPVIKTGDCYEYDVYATRLSGLDERVPLWPCFWGVTID